MSFLDEEILNFNFKYAHGITGTGNRKTAPDNFPWYAEYFGLFPEVNSASVYDFSQIPQAASLAIARANAILLPTIIADYTGVGSAIHMTPAPNGKVFFATTTYNDMNTWKKNWIKPQNHPRSDIGFVGMPSIGYMVSVYNGDPDSGGTEIMTSQDQIGGVTGWTFHFGTGAFIISSSFSNIISPADIWMKGFLYIGATGGGGGSGALLEVTTAQRMLLTPSVVSGTLVIDIDLEKVFRKRNTIWVEV